MKKKLIEIKEIYEYEGRCPKCEEEQKSLDENEVDILCSGCNYVADKEKLTAECQFLISGCINYVYTDNKGLMEVGIKTTDGKEHILVADRYIFVLKKIKSNN